MLVCMLENLKLAAHASIVLPVPPPSVLQST